MASTSELLRSLYSPEQLAQLDKVASAMSADPTIFDTHSREIRDGKVQDPDRKVGS